MKEQIKLPELKVSPKPTKSQLVDALVAREKEQVINHNAAITAKVNLIMDDIRNHCIALMKKPDFTNKHDVLINTTRYSRKGHEVFIEVKIDDPFVNRRMTQIKDLNSKRKFFCEKEVRKKYKDSLSSPKRENPLLGNPLVADALDSIMKQISNPTNLIGVSEVEVVSE